MNRSAVAVAEAPVEIARDARQMDRLRWRLAAAGATAEELVVTDLLDDDLEQARGALELLAGYLGRVEAALSDASAARRDLLALALAGDPPGKADLLSGTLASLRRRLVRIAARLPA